MSQYNFKVTNTFHYYGYPQAEDCYTIAGTDITVKLHHFGNQGFDAPVITANYRKNNGYFWELACFMKALYKDHHFQDLLSWECRQENVTKTICIDTDGTATLK